MYKWRGKGTRKHENEGVYETRRMKPVQIVLRGGRGRGIMIERVNLTKIYCKHIYRYHSVSVHYYMLIKSLTKI
jgi:hypothetical protein